ncbi:MAG TPA: cytochrome c3 family protein [bacterium]|nr:cytochrome c3 family protein [bacterium]
MDGTRAFSWMLLIAAAVLLLLALPRVAAAAPQQDSCVGCHENLGDRFAKPVAGMKDDAHAKRGLSCASCHGGNPARFGMEAHDRRVGFVGVPSPAQVPQFCARCHSRPEVMRRFNPKLPTDQLARFMTSVHGKRLAAGDPNVATCTSCHGVHPVRAAADAAAPVFPTNVPQTCARCHVDPARMARYRIPTTQFSEYKGSVHGQALLDRGNRQAPACNDCHDNHGAVPPGITSVANVCAQCHSATRDLFVRSPHKEAFDVLGQGECTTCHGTHNIAFPTDELIGAEKPAVCAQCHPAGSTGLNAAGEIRVRLERTKTVIAEAETLLARASRAGMDVSETKLELDEARTQLIIARAATHAASLAAVEPSTQAGAAAAGRARAVGEAAIAELAFRRRGLGVALVVIGFVAVTLWLKLRELESRRRT